MELEAEEMFEELADGFDVLFRTLFQEAALERAVGNLVQNGRRHDWIWRLTSSTMRSSSAVAARVLSISSATFRVSFAAESVAASVLYTTSYVMRKKKSSRPSAVQPVCSGVDDWWRAPPKQSS